MKQRSCWNSSGARWQPVATRIGFYCKACVRFGHVLNPRTGWPVAATPRSVTVAASSCTEAGLLATLALLKGADAENFLEESQVPLLGQSVISIHSRKSKRRSADDGETFFKDTNPLERNATTLSLAEVLPVVGQATADQCEDARGQVFAADPGHDEDAGIVHDEVQGTMAPQIAAA